MIQIFRLFLGNRRLRALILAGISLTFAACNSGSPVGPSLGSIPEAAPPPTEVPAAPVAPVDPLLPAPPGPPGPPSPAPPTPPSPEPPTSGAVGIPLGLFHLSSDDFEGPYNGALQQAWPTNVMRTLGDIQARGGRVILSFSGEQKYYKDDKGRFSLAKWKARIDRFLDMDLSRYIQDGTILGHYLIDEPYDAHNFGGQPVGGAVVEEMAKYSKKIWPNLPTIVRAEPYLVQWSGTYQYLDAAWAQYLHRKGEVKQYIAENVRFARSMGLALVVGLNLHHGGLGNRQMTGEQILDWGSTLLRDSDPCAFLSWKYDARYIAKSDVHSAMRTLSDMARNRPNKPCRS